MDRNSHGWPGTRMDQLTRPLSSTWVNHRIYYAEPQQSGVLFRMDFDGQNNIEVARGICTNDWGF